MEPKPGDTCWQVQSVNGRNGWRDCIIIAIGDIIPDNNPITEPAHYTIEVPSNPSRMLNGWWVCARHRLRRKPQQDTQPAESEFIEQLNGWMKRKEREEA